MFDQLSERISGTLRNIAGVGKITEDNIQATLREVRMALLEADVALEVAKSFIDEVKEEALGQAVIQSVDPGQAFVKVVNDRLVEVLGEPFSGLNLAVKPPAIILMAGLQGAGKTSAVAKLSHWLKMEQKKSVMVTSCDIYRPAAIKQLETLSKQSQSKFFPSDNSQSVKKIAKGAIEAAKKAYVDVLIVDTAGRLHVDDQMMSEIKALHKQLNPVETLFVVDAMTGQDAANTAKAFDEALPLSGVVLSKTDGDARGGAALSIRKITGKPIKFLGVGEKIEDIEPFHPDRVASRILGMGDVLSLVEQAEKKIDKKKADRLAKKIRRGRGFDLNDLKDQFQQMSNMGGMSAIVDKLPGMGGKLSALTQDESQMKQFKQMEVIIDSMTALERQKPALIRGSRKKRIALGSGTKIQDVNRLLKQHKQMQRMMKKMGSKGGMAKAMRGMNAMMGGNGFQGMR